jgi:hypothetical protein
MNKEKLMGKQKRPTPEQIIMKLREAEVIIAQGNGGKACLEMPPFHRTP